MPSNTLLRPFVRSLGRNMSRPFRATLVPTPVSISSSTSCSINGSGAAALTSTAFTPTTSDLIVLCVLRKFTVQAATTPTLTIAGLAVTKIDFKDQVGQVGNPQVWIGCVRNVPVASTAIIRTGDGSHVIGRDQYIIFSLANWLGNVGAFNTNTLHAGSSQVAGPVATISSLLHANSLILGIAGACDAGAGPFSTTGGFTLARSATNGTTGSASASASAFYKTGGAVGTTAVLTPTATGTTTGDHGSGLVEVW